MYPPSKIIALVSLLAVLLSTEIPAQQARPPAPVTVVAAIEREVAAGQTFVASVMPLQHAIVGSAVDGRVIELLAKEGQRVAAEQPLAQLLTQTIELELAAAEAELNLRQAELEEMENGSLPDEIVQAKAKMLAAKSNLDYARTGFKRMDSLRGSQAVSEGDYDEASAQASSAEQVYFDLKAAYDLSVTGPRPERIAQSKARLAMQAATVEQIQDRIKKFTVRSRFDGYVTQEFTEAGAWVKSGDPVMEIVALDEVEVRAFVAEQNVPHVKPGMEVRVEVPALPDRVFTGVVTAIVPQADPRSRTFPVKVKVKNEINDDGPLLKSGMYARIELPTGDLQTAILIPKDALVLGGQSPMVYVVIHAENGEAKTATVAPVPVELGVASGKLIQIRSGLTVGQHVVVVGNERLRPGQDVNVTSVME